jgi:hypothetical protein
MSKGGSRPALAVRRTREGDAGGGTIDLAICGPRKVHIESERTPQELRAMDPAYLAIDEQRRVVIRRGGGVIAIVVTEVVQLRRCIEQFGVRYEVDLPKTTDGMIVPVRPLAER